MEKLPKKYKGWAITKNGKLLSSEANRIPLGAEVYLICLKQNLYSRTLKKNRMAEFKKIEFYI